MWILQISDIHIDNTITPIIDHREIVRGRGQALDFGVERKLSQIRRSKGAILNARLLAPGLAAKPQGVAAEPRGGRGGKAAASTIYDLRLMIESASIGVDPSAALGTASADSVIPGCALLGDLRASV
jgi:hypothetical protein